MELFKKKTKEPPQPQYYVSATGIQTYNYRVYYMSKLEKILYFILAFIVGAGVAYLFYGGLAKDQFDRPTTLTWILNIVICTIVGVAAGYFYLPIRTKQIQEKRQKNLKLQFRELLDALTTSLGSGKNIMDSFKSAYDDLGVIYDPDSSIMQELTIILDGVVNNMNIEDLLLDFGIRSGIDDITSFANVFETCYRKGGNIREVIRNTQQIITEKMEVEMEIETIVTGSKNEQLIMTVMPVVIVGMIKFMSPEFGKNFTTPAGIIATSIGIVAFVVAYFIGRAVLSIKI